MTLKPLGIHPVCTAATGYEARITLSQGRPQPRARIYKGVQQYQ